MAFISERISARDVEKYDLAKIDANSPGSIDARDWTIDHQRGIYLRILRRGRDEARHESTWNFYWKGQLLTLRLDLLDYTGKRGGPGWSHWRLVHVNGSYGLPVALKPHQPEILQDLTDALIAYKGSGVLSRTTDHAVTLDVCPDCIM